MTKQFPRWLAGLFAALELILGFVLLSVPFYLGAAMNWVAGFIFIFVGITRLVQCFQAGHNKLWNGLGALVYLAIGVYMVTDPIGGLMAWTLIIGSFLLVAGFFRAVMAWTLNGSAGSAWRWFNSIVSLLLGGMVLFQWPESSVWLIGTLIAVEMIFSGWALLFLSLTPTKEELNKP